MCFFFLKRWLSDLGDSSILLSKSTIDSTEGKGIKKGLAKTSDTINSNTENETIREDVLSSNSYSTPQDVCEVPSAEVCRKLKSNSKRVFSLLPSHEQDPTLTVHDRYIMKDQIGSGGFSKVFRAIHRLHRNEFAIKRIHLSLLSPDAKQNIKNEVSILRSINHESIISISDIFQTDSDYFYLVMERVKGGELFNRIVENGTFSESNARLLCKSMLRAVKYCHDRGIVHRDLKPENILLVAKNSFEIKLCDFGSAGRCRKGEFLETFCGTMNYMAPEMVEGRQYNESVDMWSLGVILFVTIAGYNPFEDYDHDKLRRLIIDGHYSFESPEWFQISSICKEFIGAMMEIQPNARISADSALLHPWCSFST